MRRSVFYFGETARPTSVHTDPGLDDVCFVKNEIGAPHTAICVLVPFSWQPTASRSTKTAEFEEHEGRGLDLFVTGRDSPARVRVMARQIACEMIPRTLAVALVSEDTEIVLPHAARVPAVPFAWLVEVCATPIKFEQAVVLLGELARTAVAYTTRERGWARAVVSICDVPACMLRWGHPRELVDVLRTQIERQLLARRGAYPDERLK